MILVKFILGLIIVLSIFIGSIVLIAGCSWLIVLLCNKLKGTSAEKIVKFLGEVIYILVHIILVGIFIIIIVSLAVNIGNLIL